jgi:hypothetical protein
MPGVRFRYWFTSALSQAHANYVDHEPLRSHSRQSPSSATTPHISSLPRHLLPYVTVAPYLTVTYYHASWRFDISTPALLCTGLLHRRRFNIILPHIIFSYLRLVLQQPAAHQTRLNVTYWPIIIFNFIIVICITCIYLAFITCQTRRPGDLIPAIIFSIAYYCNSFSSDWRIHTYSLYYRHSIDSSLRFYCHATLKLLRRVFDCV